MKILILLLPLLLVTCAEASSTWPDIDPNDIDLWLEIPKTEFVVCEDIWVDVCLANLSEDTVYFPTRDIRCIALIDRFLWFELVRDDTTGVRRALEPNYIYTAGDRSSILPRDTLIVTVNLTGYFTEFKGAPCTSHLGVGSYELRGSIRQIETGDSIRFMVNKMTESDSSIAVRLRRIRYISRVTPTDLDSAAQLLTEYHASPLGPRICRRAIAIASKLRDEAAVSYLALTYLRLYREKGGLESPILRILDVDDGNSMEIACEYLAQHPRGHIYLRQICERRNRDNPCTKD